jgi:hypothetical protein
MRKSLGAALDWTRLRNRLLGENRKYSQYKIKLMNTNEVLKIFWTK